jgi:serine/threonine-protein kinase
MSSIKIIGRYEIKSEIARGGMATVFHAYDPRFERDVAIKILPQAFLHDPQFRVRFDREAKMIALLEHPAIVPVYDFGEEDGQPYIVMRYMSGGALTERMRQGAMPALETAQIISRLAPALDAAHARNIIHRDLKPGNILFDQYGNAYLSDFGIARLVAAGSATITGESILGTPAYMSPEQIQGEKKIDGRSDIYAMGVLVYQMLTGDAPYQSDTPAKVMMMHVLQPVPDILTSNADLPPGCADFIAKAMAKKPEDRFATASELAAALETSLQGSSGLVAKPATSAASTGEHGHMPDFRMATVVTPAKTEAGAPKTVLSTPTVVSASGEAVAPPPARPAGKAAAAPQAVPLEPAAGKSRAGLLIPAVVVVFILLAAAAGLAFLGRQGRGPLAMLAPATATPMPTATWTPTEPPPRETTEPAQALVTDTPAASPTAPEATPTTEATEAPPSPTPTETPGAVSTGPIIGGADKVTFLNGNNIWVSNLDGTELEQLTDDSTIKSNLQWTPDGQAVNYISGKCAYSVRLADKQKEILTCFNFVQYFKSFEISPDGKQVALSLDNQLYIVPYDLNLLRSVAVREDLTKIATCKDFAPYLRFFTKFPRWSRDGSEMAKVIMGVARGLGSADTIMRISLKECTPTPDIIDNFPPPRFMPVEYEASPMIPNFGWDGYDLFTLATYIRNSGFGKLYTYNSDLKKAQGPINVVSECCYRDPIFSPDGSQLMFAYQKYPGGDGNIQLYMVPYGTLGTGETYTPLPLPPIDPKSQPQPALRPVK